MADVDASDHTAKAVLAVVKADFKIAVLDLRPLQNRNQTANSHSAPYNGFSLARWVSVKSGMVSRCSATW